jgi:hypothetical protein
MNKILTAEEVKSKFIGDGRTIEFPVSGSGRLLRIRFDPDGTFTAKIGRNINLGIWRITKSGKFCREYMNGNRRSCLYILLDEKTVYFVRYKASLIE